MSEHIDILLEELIDAKQALATRTAQVELLEVRLGALLGADPASYDNQRFRAEQAEALLEEIERWVNSNPSVSELLPEGLIPRVKAQLLTGKFMAAEEYAHAVGPTPADALQEALRKMPPVRVPPKEGGGESNLPLVFRGYEPKGFVNG